MAHRRYEEIFKEVIAAGLARFNDQRRRSLINLAIN